MAYPKELDLTKYMDKEIQEKYELGTEKKEKF